MLQQWNGVNSCNIFFKASNERTLNHEHPNLLSYYDNVIGIYKINSWPRNLSASSLAVTQVFAQQAPAGNYEITHFDILLNYEFYPFSTSASSDNYDLSTVILHEIGHGLGLGHSSNSYAVMEATIHIEDNKRSLTPSDVNELNSLYPCP